MAADVSTGHSGDEKNKDELVTMDLLGGSGGDQTDSWEKKFQLLSRKSSFSDGTEGGPGDRQLHDLNLPPPPSPVPSFASVCTLEKVKSALERAMRDSDPDPSPRSDGSPSSSSKRRAGEKAGMDGQGYSGCGSGSMMVTVCPGCFQYLLISMVDPRCPRCEAHVPFPKKPKIDLNCSTSSSN